MSVEGRNALQKIFGSGDYKKWAAMAAHVTDANKIALEFQGKRRPSSPNPYAAGIIDLCRLNPPPLVPAPSPLAEVWQKDGVFTVALSSFAGAVRSKAWEVGFRVAYAQLLHTVLAQQNEDEIPVFTRAGWEVVGWGTYGQGSDPYQDGLSAAQKSARLGLAGWKANGESWAEGPDAWKTEAFVNGWHDGGAPVPLGWSVLSSNTDQFARVFSYPVALAVPGSDIDIQVYGAAHPTYTVDAGLGMLAKAGVPVARTTMTFDVTAAGDGPFANYRTWAGPRRIFVGEYCTTGSFQAMVR